VRSEGGQHEAVHRGPDDDAPGDPRRDRRAPVQTVEDEPERQGPADRDGEVCEETEDDGPGLEARAQHTLGAEKGEGGGLHPQPDVATGEPVGDDVKRREDGGAHHPREDATGGRPRSPRRLAHRGGVAHGGHGDGSCKMRSEGACVPGLARGARSPGAEKRL